MPLLGLPVWWTAAGRRDGRQELGARVASIVEMGFRHMQAQQVAGRDIWQKGPIRSLATYMALLQRLIDNWPTGADGAIDAKAVEHSDELQKIEAVLAMRGKHEEDKEHADPDS